MAHVNAHNSGDILKHCVGWVIVVRTWVFVIDGSAMRDSGPDLLCGALASRATASWGRPRGSGGS
ncbi:hypothetical protein WMF27_16655 [Sorangium sp. So ce281]|uniref:hypothetical protein n=1 Tax=unclassified Sorangium TaxID=2621164 RepID=UPI003F63B7B5